MALRPYSGGEACKIRRRTLDRRLRHPDWNFTRQFPNRIVVWLALIKHFFHCGWLKALLTAILAIIIFVIVTFILSLIGLTALALLLPHFG